MTAARDPRDLRQIFGSLTDVDGGAGATCLAGPATPETELRRDLASVAHAYGWMVEEEVVVPGWGRIDIVLRDGVGGPRLIELKLDLTKPAKIRRAFQQTDGYGRWWAQERGEAVNTQLVGLNVDDKLVAAMSSAYPEVGWGSCAYFLRRLRRWGCEQGRSARRDRSISRQLDLRRISLAYEAAFAELDADHRGCVRETGLLDGDASGGAT